MELYHGCKFRTIKWALNFFFQKPINDFVFKVSFLTFGVPRPFLENGRFFLGIFAQSVRFLGGLKMVLFTYNGSLFQSF